MLLQFVFYLSFRPITAKPVENVILDQPHHSEDEEEETFIVMEDEPSENLEIEVNCLMAVFLNIIIPIM